MKKIILYGLPFLLTGCYGTKCVTYAEFNARVIADVDRNISIKSISVKGAAFDKKIAFSVNKPDIYDLYASYYSFVDKYSENEIYTYQYVYSFITPFGYPEFLQNQAIEFQEGTYYINNGFRAEYYSNFDYQKNYLNVLKWDKNGMLKSVEYPSNSIKVNVRITLE